jgi:hypothetical protein
VKNDEFYNIRVIIYVLTQSIIYLFLAEEAASMDPNPLFLEPTPPKKKEIKLSIACFKLIYLPVRSCHPDELGPFRLDL